MMDKYRFKYIWLIIYDQKGQKICLRIFLILIEQYIEKIRFSF